MNGDEPTRTVVVHCPNWPVVAAGLVLTVLVPRSAANSQDAELARAHAALAAVLAQQCLVLKRSMSPGFAGIDNDLFYDPKTSMVFGDAKKIVSEIVSELNEL